MKLELYRDSAGDPRARGKGHDKRLAGWLESDLQGSPAAAREVLHAIDRVEAGREPSWERTGNAYTLTLSPEGATIQDENDEGAAPHALSLPELRKTVGDWLAFLESGARS
jgi:uncharacterized protein YacL (UPF0231 family)